MFSLIPLRNKIICLVCFSVIQRNPGARFLLCFSCHGRIESSSFCSIKLIFFLKQVFKECQPGPRLSPKLSHCFSSPSDVLRWSLFSECVFVSPSAPFLALKNTKVCGSRTSASKPVYSSAGLLHACSALLSTVNSGPQENTLTQTLQEGAMSETEMNTFYLSTMLAFLK